MTIDTAQLHWYNDPSHGWLAVPIQDIVKLGIAGQISEFSYVDWDKGLVYLEEDCDAPLFLEAANISYDKAASFPDTYLDDGQCFIRELTGFCERCQNYRIAQKEANDA